MSYLVTSVTLALLAAISLIDWRRRIIPNRLLLAFAAVALFDIAFLVLSGSSWQDLILDRLLGSVLIATPLFALTLWRPVSFGMGDVKLVAAAGFSLGTAGNCVAFAIACLLGSFYGLILLFRRRGRKATFAFGPALCFGIGLVNVWSLL
ncbi:MAG: A24 family peptidase [Coriobacteriales bacterium]|jgi:leader peptidase (prepilin peptidase)/N-methyltransferase|nr:A24 family peptidase [Coriobacteriales bacterium]